MARERRRKSTSGIYHVMLRGINKQTIFEDEVDRLRFLETIRTVKEKSNLLLYGYCLMDNHVHLLLEEQEESISKAIQRLSASYVHWYNLKYERTGHLFHGRFRSEPIETIYSFLYVLRYIHQNPVKAGVASDALACDWTSMREYTEKNSLVHTDVALSLFSTDREEALHFFTEFMLIEQEDEYTNRMERNMWSDTDIIKFLTKQGVTNISALQQMEKDKRDAIIREVKLIKGVSIRQISRVTGISKSVIARVK